MSPGCRHRTYDFNGRCVYGEIKAKSEQVRVIAEFSESFGPPTFETVQSGTTTDWRIENWRQTCFSRAGRKAVRNRGRGIGGAAYNWLHGS
jgi:hypothetical protein